MRNFRRSGKQSKIYTFFLTELVDSLIEQDVGVVFFLQNVWTQEDLHKSMNRMYNLRFTIYP